MLRNLTTDTVRRCLVLSIRMLEMFVRSTAIRLLLNSSRCTRERLSLGGFSPRNTGAACARFHNATSLRSAGRDLLETYKESCE
jgi:hypothetical protein